MQDTALMWINGTGFNKDIFKEIKEEQDYKRECFAVLIFFFIMEPK